MKKLIILKTSLVKKILAFCLIFFFSLNSVVASNNKLIFEKNKADLEKIENYLNSIKNLSANFIQESKNQKSLEGKFFLSRPGKMRIEYIEQPKILIIVNGSVLSYFDIELDEISHFSTNTTPASFLTRENISFSAMDVEITNFIKNKDQVKVSVMKKNRKEAGEFTLIFDTDPLKFVKMEVKNDLDEKTVVNLIDVTFPEKISNDLFVIKNKKFP
jgi:outer membrane lipoprotein-sorting protein